MERYAAGDAAAFEQLYARYETRLYGFCLRMLAEPDAAADAFQETFIRIIDARIAYERRGRFDSWIFTIARRVCIDSIRWEHRHATYEAERASLPVADARPGPGIQAEWRDELQRVLGALPLEQREVLLLHRYQGFSYAEIATMTQSTEAAAKQKAYRALTTLRRLQLQCER